MIYVELYFLKKCATGLHGQHDNLLDVRMEMKNYKTSSAPNTYFESNFGHEKELLSCTNFDGLTRIKNL